MIEKLQDLMKALGFGHFKWFRRWYGGFWSLTCDFHTYIQEQNRKPCRYPNRFIGPKFEWILLQENYPLKYGREK